MMSRFCPLVCSTAKALLIKWTKYTAIENVFMYTTYSLNQTVSACKTSINSPNFLCTSISTCLPSGTHESSMLIVDPKERKKLELWLEQCKYNGISIPEIIKEEDIQHIITLGHHGRLKYMNYLIVKRNAKLNDPARRERRKEQKRQESDEREKLQLHHIKYGLWKNTMFQRIYSSTLINLYYHRIASAVINNQPLIIDFSFENYMKHQGLKSLAIQIELCLFLNAQSCNPFNLTLCNVDFKSVAMTHLKKRMPNIEKIPLNMFPQSYLDLYPREKLVYLTPNANNEMKQFDPEAIYIIGGIIESSSNLPLTLAKAKQEGINMQKLPLDRYHVFKHHKSLSVHVMIAILQDLQNTGDWKKAFENIPSRFLQTATDENHKKWNMKRQYRLRRGR